MSAVAHIPCLLDLGEGFLALPRRLCASSFFRSLRPDERSVLLEMLLAARYGDGGEFWFAGQRIPLAIGELIDSEEVLAKRAGTTRKVARTVIRKCITAGVITRRRAHPSGRCPHVITVVDYGRIRYAGGEAGPRNGQPTGQERANEGPANGPHQNKGNQGEPGNPGEPTFALAPAAPRGRGKAKKTDPLHKPLLDRLAAVFREVRGIEYRIVHGGKEGKAVTDLLVASSGDVAEVETRWRRGLSARFPVHSFAALASRWNELGAVSPHAKGATPTPAQGAQDFAGSAGGFGS